MVRYTSTIICYSSESWLSLPVVAQMYSVGLESMSNKRYLYCSGRVIIHAAQEPKAGERLTLVM